MAKWSEFYVTLRWCPSKQATTRGRPARTANIVDCANQRALSAPCCLKISSRPRRSASLNSSRVSGDGLWGSPVVAWREAGTRGDDGAWNPLHTYRATRPNAANRRKPTIDCHPPPRPALRRLLTRLPSISMRQIDPPRWSRGRCVRRPLRAATLRRSRLRASEHADPIGFDAACMHRIGQRLVRYRLTRHAGAGSRQPR